MIVIAIIGLLAGISIPTFVRARAAANACTCVSQLRQIEQATQEWALECKKGQNQIVEYGDIRPYLKGAVVCPAGGKSFSDSYEITTVGATPLCRQVTGGDHPHALPSCSSDLILARPNSDKH
jgi:type II secretory pathway pseudopilin PulG